MNKILNLPFKDANELKEIKAGDSVTLNGVLYVGRDQVHKRLKDAIENGNELPFSFYGNGIYYMGPSPKMPGFAIGSAGPTTSGRMDAFSPLLIEHGLLLMVGKGPRKENVREAIVKYGGLYLQAFGGCGALYSSCIKNSSLLAYPELGPEALLKLEVENFPTICTIDSYGNSIYGE